MSVASAYVHANDAPLAVRLQLAQDPATPPQQLSQLAYTPNSRAIKQAVARNPNTPPAALLHLAGRYWADFLENPVLPLLLLEDPGLPHRLPLRVLRALVRREEVPPLILQTLARHPDREVREGAKYHENHPDASNLEPDWRAAARTAFTQLPAPPGTLAELLHTDSVPDWLLEAVASTNSSMVHTALFEASRRSGASLVLQNTANMLRRAVGEVRVKRYHHDYGHGESVRRWRIGQGPLSAAELERLTNGSVTWQLIAARALLLPAPLLEKLARSPHLKVVTTIAQRTDLPGAIIISLAGRGLLPVARALARNSSTPTNVLANLARASDTAVRQRVGRHAGASPATLAVLATDLAPAVRLAVAGNRHTPAEVLEKLVTDADPDIRERVGTNPACPLALYERYLLHDASEAVREALARRRGTPRAVLQQLCNDASAKVRQAVAINYSTPRHIYEFLKLHHHDTPAERPPMPEWGTAKGWLGRGWRRDPSTTEEDEQRMRRLYGHDKPFPTHEEQAEWAAAPNAELRRTVAYYSPSPDLLAQLATDPQAQVRNAAAHSAHIPLESLTALAADPKKKVRGTVASNPRTAEHLPQLFEQLAGDARTWVRYRAADNPKGTPAVLDQLARDPKQKVREEVAGNRNAGATTLTYLSDDPDPAVIHALLRNPSTPAAVLLARMAGASTEVRHTLAGNEGTPPDILAQLAEEDHADIRSALAYNKATPLPVLEKLWETQNEKRPLNSPLARHPNSDEAMMRRVAADTEPHAMSYLLEHPAITPELFRELLSLMQAPKAKKFIAYHHGKSRPQWCYDALLDDADPEVLGALAHQRETPEDVLLELARRAPLVTNGFDSLTYHLVSNNTVPLAVLEMLVANRADKDPQEGGPWWYERVAAHPNVTPALLTTILEACLSYRQRHSSTWIERRHAGTWLALVRNPQLPVEHLPKFADHAAREVRQTLLQRPDCPAELRDQMRQAALRNNLERGNSLLGRASAVAGANAAWLRTLYPKAGWVERLAMLQNPNLPADLLAQLAQDAHRLVRAAAQERQATGKIPNLTQ